jgi:hypothetical protein
MRRTLWGTGVVLALTSLGCGKGLVDSSEVEDLGMLAAGAPVEETASGIFDDVNPCTGLIHTVVVTGTRWLHQDNGRVIVRIKTSVTTSSGFVGHGTDTAVLNENIDKLSVNEIWRHESGDRIRAHLILIIDPVTGLGITSSRSFTCHRA